MPDVGIPIIPAIEPPNPERTSDSNGAMRAFDDRNDVAHRARVTRVAQDIAGSNATEIERLLAEAAAHEVLTNDKLAAMEVKLLARTELLLGATKLEVSLKIMGVLREVTTLRRGGTKRLEEVLRTLSELQTQQRISQRSRHLRAA